MGFIFSGGGGNISEGYYFEGVCMWRRWYVYLAAAGVILEDSVCGGVSGVYI